MLLILTERLGRGAYAKANEDALAGLEDRRALTWLTLMGLSGRGGVVPRGEPKGLRPAAVVAWGKASVISMALALLEKDGNLPLRCLPQPTVVK